MKKSSALISRSPLARNSLPCADRTCYHPRESRAGPAWSLVTFFRRLASILRTASYETIIQGFYAYERADDAAVSRPAPHLTAHCCAHCCGQKNRAPRGALPAFWELCSHSLCPQGTRGRRARKRNVPLRLLLPPRPQARLLAGLGDVAFTGSITVHGAAHRRRPRFSSEVLGESRRLS